MVSREDHIQPYNIDVFAKYITQDDTLFILNDYSSLMACDSKNEPFLSILDSVLCN